MQQKTICFYPTHQKRTNHFLFNLAKLLESSGCFKCVGYKDVKKSNPKSIFDADIYHINWFDQSKTFVSFLKRLYFLLMLKCKRKKIVWTIHNIVSHAKTPFYNKILFKLLVRFSDKIHIMCKDTVKIAHLEKYADKIQLIPHGDYYGSYPESDFDIYARYNITRGRPIFLFTGAIQPYKNIEVLVQAFKKAWPSNLPESALQGGSGEVSPMLLICGKVEPESYKETIQQLLDNRDDIVFDLQFIPDEKLAAYIKSAGVLMAPYSYRSSLNSGTIPLAFSYGKTLICSDIPCVKDIVAKCDCLYSYHYATEEEHVDALSNMMKQAYSDLISGKIFEKENNAVRYMKSNAWEARKKEWLSLYGEASC